MPHGQIAENKTRVILTLEKSDKAKLQELAKSDNRSVNNLITTIIKNYLKDIDTL